VRRAKHGTKEQLSEVEAQSQRVKGRFSEPLCKKLVTTRDQMLWTKKDLKTLLTR